MIALKVKAHPFHRLLLNLCSKCIYIGYNRMIWLWAVSWHLLVLHLDSTHTPIPESLCGPPLRQLKPVMTATVMQQACNKNGWFRHAWHEMCLRSRSKRPLKWCKLVSDAERYACIVLLVKSKTTLMLWHWRCLQTPVVNLHKLFVKLTKKLKSYFPPGMSR